LPRLDTLSVTLTGLVSEPTNPGGNMGIGAYITDLMTGEIVFKHSHFIPANIKNSNNVAEYMAIIEIIKWIINNDYHKDINDKIDIYGDSKLVIFQLDGKWKMYGGLYLPYGQEALSLLSQFNRRPNLRWIPREKNSYADDLSKGKMIQNNVEFRIQPTQGETVSKTKTYSPAVTEFINTKQRKKIQRENNTKEILLLSGYYIEKLTPYQYRLSGWIDIYPTGAKYFNLDKQEWGSYPVGELQSFIDYIANN